MYPPKLYPPFIDDNYLDMDEALQGLFIIHNYIYSVILEWFIRTNYFSSPQNNFKDEYSVETRGNIFICPDIIPFLKP